MFRKVKQPEFNQQIRTEPQIYFFLPVNRVLVKLVKLPVHRIHIHVVIFLKVVQEQLNRVVTSHKALVVLVDLFDLNSTQKLFFIFWDEDLS